MYAQSPLPHLSDDIPGCDVTHKLRSVVTLEADSETSHTNEPLSEPCELAGDKIANPGSLCLSVSFHFSPYLTNVTLGKVGVTHSFTPSRLYKADCFPIYIFFSRGQVLRLSFILILFAAWLGEIGIHRMIRKDLVFQIFFCDLSFRRIISLQ
jgi:hypothetical protein